MKQGITSKLRFVFITGTVALLSVSAQAGAPGYDQNDATVVIIQPDTSFQVMRHRSPAEIRNAVSIRMDALAAQGIEVDRAAVDGIGLESYEDKWVEAETP